MGEVKIRRVSTNSQNTFFHASQIPSGFYAPKVDRDGELTREKFFWTFQDERGNEQDLNIPSPGVLTLDSSIPYQKHNIESAKAYLRSGGIIRIAVDDFDEIAVVKASNIGRKVEALVALERWKDDTTFYANLARRLGMAEVEKQAPVVVKVFLQERCESEPEVVIDLLDSKYRDELFELDQAIATGLIVIRDKYYFYGDIQIGASEASVIDWFITYPDSLSDLRKRNAQVLQGRKVDTVQADLKNFKPGLPEGLEDARKGKSEAEKVKLNERRAGLKKLIQDCMTAGVVADKDDVLMFANIAMTVPKGNGTRFDRAVDFLMIEKNEGIAGQLSDIIARIAEPA